MNPKQPFTQKVGNQANGRKTTKPNRKLQQSSFGMWRNRQDIDENWLADGRTRWKSDWVDKRKT